MIQHAIPGGVPETDLARYIRRAWPLLREYAVKDALKRRDVRVNGVRCVPGQRVRGGDELTLYIPDERVDFSLDMAFSDGKLLIPVKPQGLPVDADRDGVGADTLLTRLQGIDPAARLCNRLDTGAGGLAVAAADGAVYEDALRAFAEKGVEKTYLALVRGGFDRREGEVSAWLMKDAASSLVRVTDRPVPGGKPILTRYRVLREAQGVAVAALNPVTGRTHQLRAHMAFLGHPLLGDDKYGDRALNRARPGPLRLWCARLAFLADGPMGAYAGARIAAPLPDWLTNEISEADIP